MKTPQWLRLLLGVFAGPPVEHKPAPRLVLVPPHETEPLPCDPVVAPPPAVLKQVPEAACSTSPAALDEMEKKAISLINRTRDAYSMKPVDHDGTLTVTAYGHASWMAKSDRRTHSGEGGKGVANRLAEMAYPWQALGEGLACGQVTAEDVVRDWFRDPHHRELMLGDYDKIGVGVCVAPTGRRYWCMLLVRTPQPPLDIGQVRLYNEPEDPRTPGCVDTADD